MIPTTVSRVPAHTPGYVNARIEREIEDSVHHHDRRWLLLPAVVAGCLLQHAVQGWCPPVSLFRRMGVRTASEIDRERYALKALRGDFGDLPREMGGVRAREALRAAKPA